MSTAIPPAAARTTPQTVPPADVPATQPGATPPAATTPGATDVRDPRQVQTSAQVAGGALTAALFVGAGLAIAFFPFAAPLFAIAGAVVGADFLGDMMGFSPVKAFTGKSIGGWLSGAPNANTPRPDESRDQNRAGFQMRAPQPTTRRTTTEPDQTREGGDVRTGRQEPAPAT